MIIFQVVVGKKKPTRQEMLDFIKQEHIIRPVTIEEAKAFIRNKYADRKWAEHLFTKVNFVYEKTGYSTNASYNIDKRQIELPEYHIGWDQTYPKEWLGKKEKLIEEYFRITRMGNINEASDELIREIYIAIKKWRIDLESPDRKNSILESMDHEIGHFILHIIKEADPHLSVSYEDVSTYLTKRMKKSAGILDEIAKRYLPVLVYSNLQHQERVKELNEVFFMLPSPLSIHPKGSDILREMIEDNNYEPAIIVKMFEIEKGKQPELNEVYEALKSYLDDNEISKLREETKDVADITGRYGLEITISSESKDRTIYTLSFSRTRKSIMEKHGLTLEQYKRFVDLRGRTIAFDLLIGECFARLLDDLSDRNAKADFKRARPGITPSDLDFFSKIKFDGEIMYAQDIEAMRKKLKRIVPIKTK
ncbi:hypothetical protein J4450_04140 [Candidatus Micrarchaeota archaeon]|nr:hypothetical protein [Candidatus Micrarchaeota archaeon]